MRKQISSSGTKIYKLVSLVWISLLIFGLIDLVTVTYPKVIDPLFWINLLLLLVVTILYTIWSSSWKEIELTGDKLIISQTFPRRKEMIVLKLADVAEVHKCTLFPINPEFIRIEFLNPTQFGTGVTFVGKYRIFPFGEHPIVDELKQMVNDAKNLPNTN